MSRPMHLRRRKPSKYNNYKQGGYVSAGYIDLSVKTVRRIADQLVNSGYTKTTISQKRMACLHRVEQLCNQTAQLNLRQLTLLVEVCIVAMNTYSTHSGKWNAWNSARAFFAHTKQGRIVQAVDASGRPSKGHRRINRPMMRTSVKGCKSIW